MVGEETEELLAHFERLFREEQYRSQLTELGEQLGAQADRLQVAPDVREVMHAVITQMEEEAGELFAPGATRKSDFFRDLAGSRYLELAEGLARESGASFDVLAGLFDKSILEVENSTEAVGTFDEHGRRALKHLGGDHPALQKAVKTVFDVELQQVASVGTGYGRQRLPFPEAMIRSEILCHGLGAHHMFPGTRTVLDIGGQDTKAIQVDESRHRHVSFQMNDRCAAGCGRYLGYIADEMNLGLHELGPMAQRKATRRVRINVDLHGLRRRRAARTALARREEREDILAGLAPRHRAAGHVAARTIVRRRRVTSSPSPAASPEDQRRSERVAARWSSRELRRAHDSTSLPRRSTQERSGRRLFALHVASEGESQEVGSMSSSRHANADHGRHRTSAPAAIKVAIVR